jgi:hypothetical protein
MCTQNRLSECLHFGNTDPEALRQGTDARIETFSSQANMLRKIGFKTLSVRADAPHDDRVFFIMTNDPSIKLNGNFELIDYYRREQLPFTFLKGAE